MATCIHSSLSCLLWNTKRFKSRNLWAGGAKVFWAQKESRFLGANGVDFWAQKERAFWAQTERDFWAQKVSISGRKRNAFSGRKRNAISGRKRSRFLSDIGSRILGTMKAGLAIHKLPFRT